jgi:hypothetical protein
VNFLVISQTRRKYLMDPILILLLALLGACPVLLLLSAITRAARRRARQAPPEEDSIQPEPTKEAFHPFPYQPTETPPEQTAGYWWSRLLSREAVLGAILVPFQLLVLVVNSYVLALRLEVLLGRGGDPLFTLGVLGWDREITLFDIVGCLISVIQVVAAAAYANQKEKFSWPKSAALGAWSLMMAVEVVLSVYAGLSNGGAVTVAILNGGLAAGLALADSLFGLYIIEHFAIPLVLALAWTLALPIRVPLKFVRAQASGYAIGPKQPGKSKRKTRVVSSIVGAVDPVFQPLRDLDAFVYRLLRRLRIRKSEPDKETKGELVCANSD